MSEVGFNILYGVTAGLFGTLAGKPAPAPLGTVLVVLSSADHIILKNGKSHPTGFYLNELMIPVRRLIEAGYALDFATPDGRPAHLDPASNDVKYFNGQDSEFIAYKKLLDKLRVTEERAPGVTSFKALRANFKQYSAVFVPGGHAPMADLVKNEDLGAILNWFHTGKLPTALICHGPVALLSTHPDDPKKKWIYGGYKLTVFSTAEEKIAESTKLGGTVAFYPEAKLKEAGAKIENGEPWKSHVVVDHELITGQNPSSDGELATQLIEALKKW